jgi:precorrin-6x reductase
MDTASIYDWFARDCMHAAEQTDDPRQREILLKLGVQWAAAAQQVRDERRPLARILKAGLGLCRSISTGK